jgi:hypothetical protein
MDSFKICVSYKCNEEMLKQMFWLEPKMEHAMFMIFRYLIDRSLLIILETG